MAKLHGTCYVIFASLVIDLLGFTVILPLMPSILDYYQKHDNSGFYLWMESNVQSLQALIGSPAEYNKVLFGGILGSWFSLIQFICMPITGSLSDTYGRKPMLLLTLIGISTSYLLWVFSKSTFVLFVVSRTVGGFSKGNVSLSTAVVTDVSKESDRGKGMALIGIAFSIGFIIGPMLGATFSYLSRTSSSDTYLMGPPLFALTLSIINIIFVSFVFRESLPQNRRALSIGRGLSQAYDYISPVSLFSFRPVLNIKQKDLSILRNVSVVYFLFLYLYSGLEFTLTFLTNLRFNYTSMQQGKVYLFAGIIMALIQGGYVRRIKQGNEYRTALIGILLIIPSFIIIGLALNPMQMYCGIFLYSFSSATVVPCLTTIVSSQGPSDQKGVILGIFRSIGTLSRALGPVTASLVFWRFGSAVCYCGGGFLLICPLIMMFRLKKEILSKDEKQ